MSQKSLVQDNCEETAVTSVQNNVQRQSRCKQGAYESSILRIHPPFHRFLKLPEWESVQYSLHIRRVKQTAAMMGTDRSVADIFALGRGSCLSVIRVFEGSRNRLLLNHS